MKKEELEKGEDYVECDDCGHIISKKRAQIVAVKNYFFSDPIHYFYCELHKKPYDRENRMGYTNSTFFREMEVSEDGTPIGYKKIEKK